MGKRILSKDSLFPFFRGFFFRSGIVWQTLSSLIRLVRAREYYQHNPFN